MIHNHTAIASSIYSMLDDIVYSSFYLPTEGSTHQYAIIFSSVNVLRFLDAFSPKFSKRSRIEASVDDNEALHNAVSSGLEDLSLLMLERPEVDPTTKNNFVIYTACRKGMVKLLNALLKRPGVDPTVNGNSCLIIACKNGHYKIVQSLILDGRVDVSRDRNKALIKATQYMNSDIMSLLLNSPVVIKALSPLQLDELTSNINSWMSFRNNDDDHSLPILLDQLKVSVLKLPEHLFQEPELQLLLSHFSSCSAHQLKIVCKVYILTKDIL